LNWLATIVKLRLSSAVRDQTLNRADAQSVFFLEFHQLWQASHRSVIM
jgi:hypothetical protein